MTAVLRQKGLAEGEIVMDTGTFGFTVTVKSFGSPVQPYIESPTVYVTVCGLAPELTSVCEMTGPTSAE